MAEVVTTKVSARTVKSTWIEDNLISMMKISHAAKRISQYYMGYPQKTVEHQLLYCEELIDLRESLLPLAPLVKPISWRKHHNTIWLHLESDSYWRLYCHFCKAIPNIHAELFMKMCSIKSKVGQLRYRSENLYDNLELVKGPGNIQFSICTNAQIGCGGWRGGLRYRDTLYCIVIWWCIKCLSALL